MQKVHNLMCRPGQENNSNDETVPESCESDSPFSDDSSPVDNTQKPDNTQEPDVNSDSSASSSRSSLSSLSSSDEEESCSVAEDLRRFALETNQSQAAMQVLFKKMRKHHPSLPADPRTLLKTSTNIPILLRDVPPGNYIHFGLVKGLEYVLPFLNNNRLEIILNIDGLYLFKSAVLNFWPILAAVDGVPNSVFVVGLYFGPSKPDSVSSYFLDFMEEVKSLDLNNVVLHNKLYAVSFLYCCCDLPAKSFVKLIQSHTGYYSCDRCVQKGITVKRRRVFLTHDATPRTDATFRNQEQPEHHKGVSPFVQLDVDMVLFFPVDYMHCLCSGLTLKMLEQLRNGLTAVKLSFNLFTQMGLALKELDSTIPSDFARRPRSMKHLGLWKSVELRMFCIYYGPFLIQRFSNNADYIELFWLLSIIFRIVCHPTWCQTMNAYCQQLTQTFLNNAAALFGAEFVTLNVHMLIHLIEDCNRIGAADKFSCFDFENFMRFLKKQVKSPHMPLQQAANRISKRGQFLGQLKSPLSITPKESECPGSIPERIAVQFEKFSKKVHVFKSTVQLNRKDCYLLSSDLNVFKVKAIALDKDLKPIFICVKLINPTDSFTSILPSSQLHIFHGFHWNRHFQAVQQDPVLCKLFKVHNDYLPILHTY